MAFGVGGDPYGGYGGHPSVGGMGNNAGQVGGIASGGLGLGAPGGFSGGYGAANPGLGIGATGVGPIGIGAPGGFSGGYGAATGLGGAVGGIGGYGAPGGFSGGYGAATGVGGVGGFGQDPSGGRAYGGDPAFGHRAELGQIFGQQIGRYGNDLYGYTSLMDQPHPTPSSVTASVPNIRFGPVPSSTPVSVNRPPMADRLPAPVQSVNRPAMADRLVPDRVQPVSTSPSSPRAAPPAPSSAPGFTQADVERAIDMMFDKLGEAADHFAGMGGGRAMGGDPRGGPDLTNYGWHPTEGLIPVPGWYGSTGTASITGKSPALLPGQRMPVAPRAPIAPRQPLPPRSPSLLAALSSRSGR